MTGNSRLNVAQIGVGYWGPNLLRNLVASKRCRVTTVVDKAADRRSYVEGLYPAVRTTADAADVLADASVDAIVIATPVASHFNLIMQALQAGKHVLVEKPMATRVTEIDQIDALAQSRGLVAMVGHTFLFNGAVRYLRGMIERGELGDIRYIYSHRLNLGRIRSDVDALWNLAPHDVSILQYLLGDPEPVSVARHGMAYVQEGIDDVVFLNIVYPGNVMAHVHVSWLDPGKVRRLTVVGSRKMVVYDDMADEKIGIYDKGIDKVARLGQDMDFDEVDFFHFQHRSGDILYPSIKLPEPLSQEIAHFFDCIEKKVPCLTGPAHARTVTRILCG